MPSPRNWGGGGGGDRSHEVSAQLYTASVSMSAQAVINCFCIYVCTSSYTLLLYLCLRKQLSTVSVSMSAQVVINYVCIYVSAQATNI